MKEEDLKKIQQMLNKSKPVITQMVCTNFWCKAMYVVPQKDLEYNFEWFKQCKKCRSMSNELSGGVTNNGTKEYEGNRFEELKTEKTIRHFGT